MRIGDLAEATGTPVETIRFYERERLLSAARRTANNYRLYTSAHVERLGFIRHCRNLDMTLDEIRSLLRLRDSPSQDCGEVNALLDEHIGHVAQRIRELRALEKDLKALRARCSTPHSIDNCGILNELDSTTHCKLGRWRVVEQRGADRELDRVTYRVTHLERKAESEHPLGRFGRGVSDPGPTKAPQGVAKDKTPKQINGLGAA